MFTGTVKILKFRGGMFELLLLDKLDRGKSMGKKLIEVNTYMVR